MILQDSQKGLVMKERGTGFWQTYYGTPSEMLAWALLLLSIIYAAFIILVALGLQ